MNIKEESVYRFIESLGIEYESITHEPAYSMEICAEISEKLGCMICKNIFLSNRQQTDFYLLMMPSDKVFKTKELSHQLGCSRLSFGSPEKMKDLIGTLPGSASVMGLMNDKDCRVQLLIDEDLLQLEFIGCHPCENTASLKIRMKDILERFLEAIKHEPVFVKLAGGE